MGRLTARDFAAMSSVAIVDAIAVAPTHFKLAMKHLEARPPDPVASARLVEHFRAGRVPAWLTAFYLGLLRDPASTGVLFEILALGAGSLSESYAGVALVKVGGAAVRDELVRLLDAAPTRDAREGAMYGLGALGDPSAVPAIVSAMARERLHPLHAGSVIAPLADETDIARWLADPSLRVRECALTAVRERVRRGRVAPPLARAALDALREERVRCWGRARAELEAALVAIVTATP